MITEEELFGPEPHIRQLDLAKWAGVQVKVVFGWKDKDKTRQFVHFNHESFYLSGCIDKLLGEEEKSKRYKIQDARLVTHNNGGRDRHTATTYASFFDEKHKEKVQAFWGGGMLGRIMGASRGDIDQADIIVRFKDFSIDSSAYEIRAPQEWYSDMYASKHIFRCVDGFYPDAKSAIYAFEAKKVDDLFGERRFPVASWDMRGKATARQVTDIAGSVKGCSKPIVANGIVFFGLRCKPYEFADAIQSVYDSGGQIPIGLEWNWD